MAYAGVEVDIADKPPPPPSLGTAPETLTDATIAQRSHRPLAWRVPARENPMWQYQSKMRRLPVPPLEQTCMMYLQSVRPLLSDEQFAATKDAVLRFMLDGSGERLQKRLEARAAAKTNSSWLIDWWNSLSYFGFREPVVINVSYFYSFKPDDWSGMVQTRRGAGLVQGVLAHRALVLSEQLPNEGTADNPMDMSMYRFMYSSCRVAWPGEDLYITHEPAAYNHFIVMRRGRVFTVDAADSSGTPHTTARLERQLREVVRLADSEAQANVGVDAGVGILTTWHRDSWAEARAHLLAAGDGTNQQSLEKIETAFMVLCLDHEAPADGEQRARAAWHGDGHNRWFDKPLQFVVSANGAAGFVGEHGMMDGQPTAVMCDWVLDQLATGKVDADFSASPTVAAGEIGEVGFVLDSRARGDVAAAATAFHGLIGKHDLYLVDFREFGKAAIKKDVAVSPDAFCQLAIQLAYFRHTGGKRGATYESCSVRTFLHGRTETIRSCHSKGAAFVDAMAAGSEPKVAYALMREAAQHQSWYSRRAAQAQGCDRHLMGLKLSLAPDEAVPDVFTDGAYARSSHWDLSTSTLASEHFACWGFGEVYPDGFGVGYMCNKNSFAATVTAVSGVGATAMGEQIQRALRDMHAVALSARKAAKL